MSTAPLELRDLEEAALRGPLRLLPNRIARFYRGGLMIDAFLGVPAPADDNFSEEWLGNANAPVIGAGGEEHGLARAVLLDGSAVTLRDLFERRPEQMLGAEHVARYGTSSGILLKLLDVRTPIPVHCHPSQEFARRHLGSQFGKSEAWLVLGAREVDGEPARVWVGWRERVDRRRLWDWIERQDIEAMRAAMHAVEVKVDDVLFVPAGTVHSLGAGVFAMEPQEPTDLAVFAEHATYDLDESTATNGLGWERMLDVFDYETLAPAELDERIRCAPVVDRQERGGRATRLVSDAALEFFRLGELAVEGSFAVIPDGTYALDCVREGFGVLRGSFGEQFVRRGETYVVPAALGEYEIVSAGREPLRILRARPPR